MWPFSHCPGHTVRGSSAVKMDTMNLQFSPRCALRATDKMDRGAARQTGRGRRKKRRREGGSVGWTFFFFILRLSDLDSCELQLDTRAARSGSATVSPLSLSLPLSALLCSPHSELSAPAAVVKKRRRRRGAAAAAPPPALRLLFFSRQAGLKSQLRIEPSRLKPVSK